MDTPPLSRTPRRPSLARSPAEAAGGGPAQAVPLDRAGTERPAASVREAIAPARATAPISASVPAPAPAHAPALAPQDEGCHARVARRLRQWGAHLGQGCIGLPLLSAGTKLGVAGAAGGHVALRTSAGAAAAASLVQAGLGHLSRPVAADRDRLRPRDWAEAGPARAALRNSLGNEELCAPLLGGLVAALMPLGDAMVIADAVGAFPGHEPAPRVVADVTVAFLAASALLDLLAARSLAHTRVLADAVDADARPAQQPPQQPPQEPQPQIQPVHPAQPPSAGVWEVDVDGRATVRVPPREVEMRPPPRRDSSSPPIEEDFLRDSSIPEAPRPRDRKTVLVTITRPGTVRHPPDPAPTPARVAPPTGQAEEV